MTQDTPQTATPEAPRIAVRGEAHIEAEPEIARIGITVAARGTDRRTALEDLTRRNTHVLDLIKGYGDAIDKTATGALSITPELTKRGRGERIRTYHGRVHITADLTDFTALGELTTRLADLDLTSVDGPWWSLRPTSPVHAQARQQAVREAVQRAREYAEALGTTLAALIEIADIGADNPMADRPMPPPGAMRMAAFAGADAEPAPALDLEPQRQRVRAEVNARFTMHPPTL
ncbi:SIMPL domain-containing protein [Streptomyces sp. BH055]|uniref:SIMPL domain-containing protein n=1 Tax=unclassified Streptomyces TaxID=2593676 RepID=UPI003BB80C54